jgi:peptide/nickel transport system permease protein
VTRALTHLGQAIFVIWAAYTLTFLVLYLLPGDPATILVLSATQENDTLDQGQIDALRAEWGLDRPLYEQYFTSLWGALHLDFGLSYETRGSAWERVVTLLPQTGALAAAALVLAVVFGGALAIAANSARQRWVRRLLAAVPPLGVSLPGFWIGLLLIQLFSFRLGLLPASGSSGAESLILPAITLAIPTGATLAQLFARSLEVTLTEPFITVLRSRGADHRRVIGHAVRNAVLPVLTMVGMLVGQLFAGAAITETVFSRDGIGKLTVDAVSRFDGPVLLAIVVVVSATFVISSLLVDLIYPYVDPRLRTAGPRGRTSQADKADKPASEQATSLEASIGAAS